MSKVNKPPISLSRLARYMGGKVYLFNILIYSFIQKFLYILQNNYVSYLDSMKMLYSMEYISLRNLY